MKILICGKDSEFAAVLSLRLKNEKHEVYLLTGETIAKERCATRVFQKYDFSFSDESVATIIKNISPDIIVIAGVLDFYFRGQNLQKKSIDYITGMTNLLLSAKSQKVPRIIYCSSYEIFETVTEAITKETSPTASSLRGTALSKVDILYNSARREGDMSVEILRFPEIYGNYAKNEFCEDFVSKMLIAFLENRTIEFSKSTSHMVLSLRDAVQSIMSVIASEQRSEIYHIGGELCGEKEIANAVVNLDKAKNSRIVENEDGEKTSKYLLEIENVDNDRLKLAMRYKLIEDLPSFYKALKSNFNSKKTVTKGFSFKRSARALIETAVFFFLFSILQGILLNNFAHANADIYILFVVIVAVVYGASFAMLATALCLVGNMYFASIGAFAQSSNIAFDLLTSTLQIAVCGVIVGLMRDSYSRKNRNLIEQNEYNEKQLSDITRINDSNMYIKNIYGKRISAYNNNLARLYSITSQLSFLDVRKVIFQTAKVVSEIIETEHVAIYVSSTRSDFFRLAASTSKQAASVGKSFYFDDKLDFYSTLKKREVFMNRDFKTGKPTYIRAVHGEDKKVMAIIMIWATELEQVSLYQSSLVAILGRLVERTMASALDFENLHFENAYILNSRVMEFEAFRDRVDVLEDGRKMGLMSYIIVKIENLSEDIKSDFNIVEKLVRDTDYIGSDMKDIYVLLANSNEAEAQYVLDRFHKNNLLAIVVTKDEIMEK